MKKHWKSLMMLVSLVAVFATIGCASHNAYQKAFDSQSALTHNQRTFAQPPEVIFKIVKQVFIQQGFTVESADLRSGIVKAVRNMQDKEDSEISYNIHASADISEITGSETNVSLAASQQTILHRATYTWWHLFWIIPIIPTGTEYQTLVTKEGNITDPGFYTDFFNSCNIAVTKYEQAVKAAAIKAAEKAAEEKKAAKIKADAEAKAAFEKAEAEAAAKKAEEEKISAEKGNVGVSTGETGTLK